MLLGLIGAVSITSVFLFGGFVLAAVFVIVKIAVRLLPAALAVLGVLFLASLIGRIL
jgi:hypothetical protein